MYRFNRLFGTCVQPTPVLVHRPRPWPELARSATRTTDATEAAPVHATRRRSDRSRTPSPRA
jgi:hypothetical protein